MALSLFGLASIQKGKLFECKASQAHIALKVISFDISIFLEEFPSIHKCL